MECFCNICCQSYQTDNTEKSKRTKKVLSCNHELCESCYLRLDKTHCPFCRKVFTYSKIDLVKRNKLNLDYNWQPPSQILNYIPPENNNHISTIQTRTSNNTQNREEQTYEPFSRVRKNMTRRRRRTLSFDEVLDRRRIIRKRCRRKWMKKNGRLEKELLSMNVDD